MKAVILHNLVSNKTSSRIQHSFKKLEKTKERKLTTSGCRLNCKLCTAAGALLFVSGPDNGFHCELFDGTISSDSVTGWKANTIVATERRRVDDNRIEELKMEV